MKFEVSPREYEILTRLAEGKTAVQIGKELYITSETVKTHKSRMFFKFKCVNTADLIAQAFLHGYLGNENVKKRNNYITGEGGISFG